MTVAGLIARFLASRGVSRVYGLVGGHIQPIWDELADRGIRIVDVRHESAAVYMAHAESLLTGRLGVALVTAGPGLTNAMTGIANAHVARAPVLVISGRTPRPQVGMGAMQDVPQARLVEPICRRVEAVQERHHVLPRLDAVTRAALGDEGSPGPAYIDFPTDLLRESVADAEIDHDWLREWTPSPVLPDERAVIDAARVIRTARRPLVIGGRAVRDCAAVVERFLAASGALYLDTSESRGAVSAAHPAFVPAMRGRVMSEADVIVTLGRRLDFQLGYGSPAILAAAARFVRVGRTGDEIADNRRGAAEVKGDVATTLTELLALDLSSPVRDIKWHEEVVAGNAARIQKLANQLREMRVAEDGRIHPYALIAAVNDVVDDAAVLVADGGDILSFARVALKMTRGYLDPGPLGCIGVGVPFANAAALNAADRQVVAVVGDGSFGFMAMEVETAVRHKLPVVYVVANNEGWNIDRHDQQRNYKHVVGVDLPGCRYDRLAGALGAYGERVEDVADLGAALRRAMQHVPAVIDVLVSAVPTSPDFESGLAEVCGRQALRKWHDAEELRLSGARGAALDPLQGRQRQ